MRYYHFDYEDCDEIYNRDDLDSWWWYHISVRRLVKSAVWLHALSADHPLIHTVYLHNYLPSIDSVIKEKKMIHCLLYLKANGYTLSDVCCSISLVHFFTFLFGPFTNTGFFKTTGILIRTLVIILSHITRRATSLSSSNVLRMIDDSRHKRSVPESIIVFIITSIYPKHIFIRYNKLCDLHKIDVWIQSLSFVVWWKCATEHQLQRWTIITQIAL